ncbi:ejaculatory bulb-specific protein 3-like [Prorops nasuta]|uniref:ejaculatory bulb-specific protein 3-like n=1 Tax=Prorops nasuta TaxID=863751 RepID=UPI0034D001CB
MRGVALTILMVLAAAIFCAYAQQEELYSDKYDYVNADEILVNDRLRDQYYKCFYGSGPCVTADAKFFKNNFGEAIVTKCKKCTEKQKTNFDKMISWYNENEPQQWEALVKKFVEDAQAGIKPDKE